MKTSHQSHGTYDRQVDTSGLHCPQPVIHCKAALSRMGRGDVLEMITTDRDSLREVRTLVNTLGDELLAIETVGNHYRFLIESRSPSQKKPVRSLRTALASHLGTALRNIGVPALTFTT